MVLSYGAIECSFLQTHGVVCGGGQKKESILDLKKIVSTVIAECKNKQ